VQSSSSEYASALGKEIEALCLKKLSVRIAAADQDLFETGVLDSLLLVQLIFELERHFHLELPMGELDISSLKSVNAMARLIEGRLSALPNPPSRVVNQLAG
jgi:acyl carrier protein